MELTMTFESNAGRFMRISAIVVVGSCLTLRALNAQQTTTTPEAVSAGERVRISAPGLLTPTRRTGRLISIRGDTVLLQPDGGAQPVALPPGTVADMEVSRGQHRSTGTGIVVGALVGGAAGAIAVAVTPNKPKPCPINPVEAILCGAGEGIGPSVGETEVGVGLLGAIVGGVVGGVIGHARLSEIWEPVSRRAWFAVTPMLTLGGASAAGVRLALAW